jgi:hypothetical protein
LNTDRFDNKLTSSDNTVQAALETLVNHRHDANEIDYQSEVHNLLTDVKSNLDGIWHFLSFVNLYINGGHSVSTYYTGSQIDGGDASSVQDPNAIMDAGFSQEHNKKNQQ